MGSRNNKPARIVKGTAKQPTLKDASGIWTLDEAMQAHRANSWPQPNLFQPIPKSLRFKNNTSYVTRQITKPGNQRTFTASLWVKRDTIGTRDGLFTTNNSGGNSYWGFEFGSDDRLYVYDSLSSTLTTTQVFRDTSAWYHIVVAVDTLQSTSSNRTKIYVNGIQVTSFSSAGYPAQGLATRMNGLEVPNQAIGCWIPANGTYHFGGYITEVNVIDGYQLNPTFFGKFDTNNTWVPVAYSGTYGTNGFYLPFNNATTSQTLGYDASLNGTTTYNADQDPYRSSVSLHLTGNGPAGGQNNTFVDSSPNNLTITRNGAPTQGSFSPFPMQTNTPYNPAVHGASAYFGGASSSDYLALASNAAWAFSTGDFTIESWIYLTSLPNTYLAITACETTGGIWFGYLSTGLGLRRYNVADVIQSATAPQTNTWIHLAVTRSGATTRLFINGILDATVTNSDSYAQANLVIGSDGGPGSASQRWPGYISGLRITKGVAIYTAAFTPANRPFGTLTNNLLTFSEDFNNSSLWNRSGTTAIASSAVAPDGNPSATLLAENAGGTVHYIDLYRVFTTSLAHTNSIYIKAAGRSHIMMRFYTDNSVFSGQIVGFNLVTGTVGYTSGSVSASIQNVGNGWYRLTTTVTTGASATGYIGLYLSDVAVTTTASPSYSGDGISGVYIWGAQLELASSVTAYTPTPANYSTAPSLLLNFANAAVVDSAGAGNAITYSGATITSASKYGSGAMTYNGTSDWIAVNSGNNASLTPGTKDFTVEFWMNTRTGNDGYRRIVSSNIAGFTSGSFVMRHQPGSFLFTPGGGVSGTASYSLDFTINTWTHIAYSRQGATGRGFINGQQVVTCGDTSNYTEAIQYIGAQYTSGSEFFSGSLDDVRITIGVARYQDSFTPPARAYPEIGGDSFVTTNVNAGVVQRFTTIGTTSWTAPTDVTSVEVLVVGGGGGGGVCYGGGAGGGGLIYNNAYPVTPGQTYTVVVGAGGTNLSNVSGNGGTGGNSSFGNLVAIGGGYGGGNCGNAGGSGGSGGGGSSNGSSGIAGGSGTPGQGFAGASSPSSAGGGGGAAGGLATAGTSQGANGLQFGISGTTTYYAGGGSGGQGSPGQAGGLGGGGFGGIALAAGVADATPNTGGGGGGTIISGSGTSGIGGSGIVIVRYTTATTASHSSEDSLVDSPTQYGHDLQLGGEVVGNYATWNPLVNVSATLSNGNLRVTPTTVNATPATIFVNTGKWYWEVSMDTLGSAGAASQRVGVVNTAGVAADLGGSANGWCFLGDGRTYNNGSTASYGSAVAANDIVNVALDVDAGKIWYGKNGVWFASGAPAGGTSPSQTFTANQTMSPAVASGTGSPVYSANFGQRPFVYPAPAGYNALTTKNLPRLTNAAAITPNQYFDTVLWTGNGTSQTITLPGAFQPDLIWLKGRNNASWGHFLQDSVRGVTEFLKSNTAEVAGTTTPNLVNTITSTGFTVLANGNSNNLNDTYVAWCWKAGGAPVSNTNGSVASSVSANTTSGFSIVSYAGSQASNFTIGHGLTTAPNFIITKARNASANWGVYYTANGANTNWMQLNSTAAQGANNASLSGGAFLISSATTLQIDSSSFANSGSQMIAYCWTEVPGFSKFGSYTGNGSTDGPFIYTGFKPRLVMVKCSSSSDFRWIIWDTARDPINFATRGLSPNLDSAEITGFDADILSNGFKLRDLEGTLNGSGATYIFMAFADKPFGNINGTAR